ncbi:hypothetical protein FACS189451_12020 [Bacteroidia bacterium]|nr:hypothetical protein FACS189451_12020 [Bacteroidia bacterium]
MKKLECSIIICTMFICTVVKAQSEFVKAWDDENHPLVMDVYVGNTYNIEDVLKDSRIKGIIHKMSDNDKNIYRQRRAEATSNNLLFGSYWLPRKADGAEQANKYLEMIGEDYWDKEFLALDFEPYSSRSREIISIEEAYRFVEQIHKKAGRYPYIYCNLSYKKQLESSKYKDTFGKCKLWIISLRQDIFKPFGSKKIWETYHFWQFSTEHNCLYKVKGLECGIDFDVYNGNYEDLVKNWAKVQ